MTSAVPRSMLAFAIGGAALWAVLAHAGCSDLPGPANLVYDAMSDVAEVLPLVDGALMIVRSGQTKKSLIPPTVEILGDRLLGVVLNDSFIDGSAYYGGYGYNAYRKRKK